MESKLIITLTTDGQVTVAGSGPAMGNKISMLGLIEVAKSAIANQQTAPATAPSPLLVARGSLPNGR